MTESEAGAVARRALPLLDLTDLGETCTEPRIDALCRDAKRGGVAAICVWPRFIEQGARALAGTGIRIATVINFPDGGEDCARATDDTAEALRDGADEIDLVLPYRALLRGEAAIARDMVEAVRDTCGSAILKVILETGELADPDRIREASRIALEAGADFLKTSTGKSAVSATPEAAEAMLDEIRASGRPAGLKVSGGLRSIADAATYLALADRLMGPAWVSPKTFRLGASSLFAALIQARES
ncbi:MULTISPECIES: deoxyribose-phosphate aldolase [Methylobacterium]|jgi:deoxyribose-phosphate aldolase|uniref:deoxyribose-phosphate aldolase n=1 Tax=Methylobacterium TaxID=407 RepID=UPI0005BE64D8|nr:MULTISPECIES: deoxyribose-phosphate aldolase [Methylobacterium]KOX58178.1 deoxyribose-phosphate aldolase [Streptomyces purpurogeneiscleroticus]MBP33732.1 deoxyribose-phosphate aldolase [Methylobacterium sp.]MDH3030941.1 deoxyribose-phosphate aldolase [Methylobacterium fujisawaense]SFV04205.1 deoxyribose-phosphate aldolase [Methylobacterium sp. UNCCL125]